MKFVFMPCSQPRQIPRDKHPAQWCLRLEVQLGIKVCAIKRALPLQPEMVELFLARCARWIAKLLQGSTNQTFKHSEVLRREALLPSPNRIELIGCRLFRERSVGLADRANADLQ